MPRAGRGARGGRRGRRAARESVRDLWRPLGRARGLPVAQDGRARSPPATQHPIWKASWRGALANSATRRPRPPSSPLAEADFLQGTRIVSSKTGLRQVGSRGHAVVHAADGRAARAVKKAARVRRRVAHALGRSEAARTPRGRKGRARVTPDDPIAGRGAGGGAPAAVRHARLERLAHLPEGEACARGVSARRAHHPVRHNAIRTSRGRRQGRRTIAAERRRAGGGARKRACACAGLAAILAPAAARARGSQTGEHAAPLAAGHAGPPHAVGRRRAHLPRDMRAACPTRARGGGGHGRPRSWRRHPPGGMSCGEGVTAHLPKPLPQEFL